MKYMKNEKILISFLAMLIGFIFWVIGAQNMGQEISILHATCAIAGAALLFSSEAYFLHKILELEYLEQIHQNSEYITGVSDTAMSGDVGARSSGINKSTPQMRADSRIIALSISGIIAGIALSVLPVILWNKEYNTFGLPCVLIGMMLFGFSLFYLEQRILKSKRPELYRRQDIELKDERNIIIRDKAGAKTLLYLWSMLIISNFAYVFFDIEYNYVDLMMNIMFISVIIYAGHYYYFKKRL